MTEFFLDAPRDELLKFQIVSEELDDLRDVFLLIHIIYSSLQAGYRKWLDALISRDEELYKCLTSKHIIDVVHSLQVITTNRLFANTGGPRSQRHVRLIQLMNWKPNEM
jgi:hypothetical protein